MSSTQKNTATAPLVELLGENLVQGKSMDSVKTSEALKHAKVVGLYFSAHWCPPCRHMTPKLASALKDGLKAKGMEIVFVSSDHDEKAMKEYFAEEMAEKGMLALPYGARDLLPGGCASISKKYGVSGIPTLVLLDGPQGTGKAGAGATITTEGRAAVMGDVHGEKFPWYPADFAVAENAQKGDEEPEKSPNSDNDSKLSTAAGSKDEGAGSDEDEQIPADLPKGDTDPFVKLLGKTLLKKSKGGMLSSAKTKEVDTATALHGKKAVALYFSAHWCPPCRNFTPRLAEWYTKDLKKKGIEVVFVSSDRDEESFNSYFKEQPWLALPHSDSSEEAKALKAELARKYKVSGIPKLVVLDGPLGRAPGEVVTLNGREAVSEDPKGEKFAAEGWYPKTLAQILEKAEVVGKDGQKQTGALSLSGKDGKPSYFAVYFSAHWCPPCRSFTPKLVEMYKKLRDSADEDKKNFEIVFASSDQNEAAFKEYFAEMPWLALPFESENGKETKKALSTALNCSGIPQLAILKADVDGKISVVRENARGAAAADPEGKDFPWAPKPVNDIDVDCDGIDEQPSLVLMVGEGKDAEEAPAKALELLRPIAEKYRAAAAANDGGAPKFNFFYGLGNDGRISAQIKSACSCDDWKPAESKEGEGEGSSTSKMQVVLLDIDDNGAYYKFPHADKKVTADSLQQFLDDFEAKKLTREQMG